MTATAVTNAANTAATDIAIDTDFVKKRGHHPTFIGDFANVRVYYADEFPI